MRFEVNIVMSRARSGGPRQHSSNVLEVLHGLGIGGEATLALVPRSHLRNQHISRGTATDWRLPKKGVLLAARCHAEATREGLPSKLGSTPPQRKIIVTSKSPVGDISVVTLIRTYTTLDHSQKAENVCYKSLELAEAE